MHPPPPKAEEQIFQIKNESSGEKSTLSGKRSMLSRYWQLGLTPTCPDTPEVQFLGEIFLSGLHPDTCPSISNTIKSLFYKLLILQKPQKWIQETSLDLSPHCSRCDLLLGAPGTTDWPLPLPASPTNCLCFPVPKCF